VVAASLTKLVLRLGGLGVPRAAVHRASASAMLAIVAMLRLGESAALPTPLDDDSRDRMGSCIKVLAAPEPDMVKVRTGEAQRADWRAVASPVSLHAAWGEGDVAGVAVQGCMYDMVAW
jgi:hypothetical protein